MPRFRRTYDYDDNSSMSDEIVNELFSLERSIDRRLAIFLALFAFVVVGALGSGNASISSAGFSIGSILCWLLAISIILTTKKSGYVSREIKLSGNGAYAKVERKLYSKMIRWILGYIIPVFCSIVLTFGSVASSVGWLDNIWFYKSKIESKVDQITNSLPEIKIEKKTPETNPNFKPVDSVVTIPSKKTESQPPLQYKDFPKIETPAKQKENVKTKTQPQKSTPSQYFKPIDSLEKK